MNYACIHTHTIFGDGSDDIETFCRVAFAKGLKALGFSEHAPVTKKTGFRTEWHLPDEKLPEYIEAIQAAKKRWEGKLAVYSGLEVDFIPGIMGPADKDYREMGLDYTIASVHYVFPPNGKPFTVDDSLETVSRGIKEGYGGDPMGMVEAYFEAEAAMIRAGGFEVLGHPDLVKIHNAGNILFSKDDEFYRKKIAEVAALMTGTGTPAEVNTGGMNRGRINECYPSIEFLKHFRKHGVPMTINADAHKAKDLDGHYEDARKNLLDAGYTEAVLFGGKHNGKAIWETEKL